MEAETRLVEDPFRPDDELGSFIGALHGGGAVVSFTGIARPADAAGDAVTGLFLDSYPGMTEASLQAIARSALERFPVSGVHVVHRCGRIAPGEPIVFVAAAAPHRRAAFDAVDFLMDLLKTEAVLWKREDGPSGSKWIEPNGGDVADRARWSD